MARKTPTVFVIPRRGVELAGIPSTGAEVAPELAKEWQDAGLVRRPAPVKSTPATPAKEG